jgi:hypothetical protein
MGWTRSSYSAANGNCLEWRVSSYCESGGDCVQWRASSFCAANECVQVGARSGGSCGGMRSTQVRDSKDPDGLVLSFAGPAWREFIRRAKAGSVPATG